MVSANSFRPIVWFINMCSYMGTIPAYWDSSKGCMKLKLGRKVHLRFLPSITVHSENIVPSLYIALQMLNIFYLLIFLTFLEQSHLDKFICALLLTCFIFGIANQICVVLYCEELFCLVNSFLLLDLKMRKCLTSHKI